MKKFQSGQIVLITLLVLAVGTTLALSLIGRSTINTAISSQLEESSRAFSAAEAGIEEALLTGLDKGVTVLTPGTSYQVNVTSVGGSAGIYQLSKKTLKGTTETLWFVNHNADGSLNETLTFTGANVDICWSYEQPTESAIAVTILYKNSAGSYQVARDAFDSVASRVNVNKFTAIPSPPSGGCGFGGYYKKNISFASYGINPLSDILLALRIRPVYADSQFAFNPNNFTIPLQGSRIESIGTTQTGVTRKVVVDKTYTSAPTVFDAAIYSQSSFSR